MSEPAVCCPDCGRVIELAGESTYPCERCGVIWRKHRPRMPSPARKVADGAAELVDLAHMVEATRAAQREYFETRDKAALASARKLERDLDATVAAILRPGQTQQKTFIF